MENSLIGHPSVFKYEDAVQELVKAAERVDDYRELGYWARIVKQMTPPKFCQCPETDDAVETRGRHISPF